jgi:diguanylate cyclase (GGDEF)-like protein
VSLGRGRAAAGDAAEALRLLQRGVDVTSRGDSKRQQAAALTALGLLQARLGEHGLALDDLHRALGLAEAVQVRREIYQPHEALAEAYERRGDLRAALEHFKAFQRLRSEVWDGVARARLDTLMVEFELEKARQQREIEQLRNVELKRAYEKLQELHAQVARQADELAELAVRDGLTGVYNRRHLDRALQHELARARRYAQPLSVALLDVDEFKHVNDRHSHAVGDLVLRRLAALMAGLVRQSDVIARYGGEEFALVFPGTQLVQAAAACEKVRQAVDALDWSEVAPDLRVTVSVGVAMDPGTLTWDKLLDEADAQLYLAKSQGRNRVCAAGESVG